ncbi:MAG: FHA domain-containing protein [Betaproteobacteria bacterium]|nr:FHA domain-containing protein [Betaproteobacteria bacterium]
MQEPSTEAPTPSDGSVSEARAAILFADVAGSSRLYETLGDQAALFMIAQCLEEIGYVARQFGGEVIKSIGDEIMCLFAESQAALRASAEMQSTVTRLAESSDSPLQLRVGFHHGDVLRANSDVFGDTVNVAARVVRLCRPGQILTTSQAIGELPEFLRVGTRRLEVISVKGRQSAVEVFEVMWQWGEQTTILEKLPPATQNPLTTLELVHEDKVYTVNAQSPTLRVGRDRASEVVVAVTRASRGHARVEFRKDKFYLADHSSNGTFVRFHGEEEVRVSREELALTRPGEMSFGEPSAPGEGTVRFEVY